MMNTKDVLSEHITPDMKKMLDLNTFDERMAYLTDYKLIKSLGNQFDSLAEKLIICRVDDRDYLKVDNIKLIHERCILCCRAIETRFYYIYSPYDYP